MRPTHMVAAAFLAAASALPFASAQDEQTVPTVNSLDLDRFGGLWHEMARYDTPETDRACLNPTREFGFDEDGNVAVVGTCSDKRGVITSTTLGTATVTDEDSDAKLSLSYGEGDAEDMWVVAVADDYSWVLISDPARDHLQIMTREPVSGGALKNELVAKAAENGFDASKLFFSQIGPQMLSQS